MISMKRTLILSLSLFLPSIAFAQNAGSNIFSLMTWFLDLIQALGGFFLALSVMLFFWGLVKFITNAADAGSHEDGKQYMIWGVISFFVIATLWALVQFLIVTFGLTPTSQLQFIDRNGAVQGR